MQWEETVNDLARLNRVKIVRKKKRRKERKEGRISRDISSNRRIYHRTATSRACFFGTDNSLRNCRPLNRPFPPVSPRRWTHKEGGLSYPKKEKAARRRADRKRNSRNPRRITTRRRILPARQIKIRSNGRTRKNKRERETLFVIEAENYRKMFLDVAGG